MDPQQLNQTLQSAAAVALASLPSLMLIGWGMLTNRDNIRDLRGSMEREFGGVREEFRHRIGETNRQIEDTNRRIDETNRRFEETNRRIDETRDLLRSETQAGFEVVRADIRLIMDKLESLDIRVTRVEERGR